MQQRYMRYSARGKSPGNPAGPEKVMRILAELFPTAKITRNVCIHQVVYNGARVVRAFMVASIKVVTVDNRTLIVEYHGIHHRIPVLLHEWDTRRWMRKYGLKTNSYEIKRWRHIAIGPTACASFCVAGSRNRFAVTC